MDAALLDELSELLRIPSVSADSAHFADVVAAGEWVCAFLRRAGGECRLVDWHGQPIAVGELRASENAESAPTVLCYGHFDVQPPAPLEEWHTPPFEPTVRDGWLYARGVADDKGQLWMLLHAAAGLAAEGRLPVNVRFACDGEEETGGHSIVEFLEADERGADACVIFDSSMLARGVPCFNLSARGMAYFHVKLRTGARDLHSGMFGGAALNALHALIQTLQAVLPGPDGLLPEPLRVGIAPPSEDELAAWRRLQPGAEVLLDQGARPADATGAEEFYLRTWAGAAVDVHGIQGGSPVLQKTVLPVFAEANLSIRLAPGQEVDGISAEIERLLRDALPAGAELELERWSFSPPGLVAPDERAVQLGLDAFERVLGVRPLLVRSGGSLPIVPALAEKGIPTVITGFDLPEGNIHSPNERLLLEYLPLGVAAARELFLSYAAL
jgi:acetylornithine deacetylase/succinyl-diaminopimelate desuccinylase-like protein